MAKAKKERKAEAVEETTWHGGSRAPIVETAMTMSEDGKWFIHKTVITDIKPRLYLERVLED